MRQVSAFRNIPLSKSDPILDAIAENLEQLTGMRGKGSNKAVLWEDLKKLGIAKFDGRRATSLLPKSTTGTATTPDVKGVEPPKPPQNVSGRSTFSLGVLTWDLPQYYGHAFTEVYQSTSDSFSSATLVGTTPASIFSIALNPGVKYYFWLRNVNKLGDKSAIHASHGVLLQTKLDPDYLLREMQKTLQGDWFPVKVKTSLKEINIDIEDKVDLKSIEQLEQLIAESAMENAVTTDLKVSERRKEHKLFKALVQRSYYTSAKVDEVMAAELSKLESKIVDPNGTSLGATIKTNYITKVDSANAISSMQQTLNSKIATESRKITSDVSTRFITKVDSASALSAVRTQLDSKITTETGKINTNLANNFYTSSDVNTAMAAQKKLLEAELKKGDTQVKSFISQNYTTKSDSSAAIATAKSELSTSFNNSISGLRTVYQSKADASTAQSQLQREISSQVNGLKSDIQTNYFTKTDTNQVISNASNSLTSSYQQYVATQLQQYVTQANQTQALAQQKSVLQASINGVSGSVTQLSRTVGNHRGDFESLWGVKATAGALTASIGLVAKTSGAGIDNAYFTIKDADFRVAYTEKTGKKPVVKPIFGTMRNPRYDPNYDPTDKNADPTTEAEYIVVMENVSLKVGAAKHFFAEKITGENIVAGTLIDTPVLKAPQINDIKSNFYVSPAGQVRAKDFYLSKAKSGSRLTINNERIEVWSGSTRRIVIGKLT